MPGVGHGKTHENQLGFLSSQSQRTLTEEVWYVSTSGFQQMIRYGLSRDA
jgi:hypothetical protein